MAKQLTLISPSSIQYVNEDKLRREVNNLEMRKSTLFRSGKQNDRGFRSTLREIETEICYLQREIEVRQRRKRAHAEFLQKRSNKRAKRR